MRFQVSADGKGRALSAEISLLLYAGRESHAVLVGRGSRSSPEAITPELGLSPPVSFRPQAAEQRRAVSEQSIEFVKGVYGAFTRGDVPAVLGAFADDIEWYEAEGMPYGVCTTAGRPSRRRSLGTY